MAAHLPVYLFRLGVGKSRSSGFTADGQDQGTVLGDLLPNEELVSRVGRVLCKILYITILLNYKRQYILWVESLSGVFLLKFTKLPGP